MVGTVEVITDDVYDDVWLWNFWDRIGGNVTRWECAGQDGAQLFREKAVVLLSVRIVLESLIRYFLLSMEVFGIV